MKGVKNKILKAEEEMKYQSHPWQIRLQMNTNHEFTFTARQFKAKNSCLKPTFWPIQSSSRAAATSSFTTRCTARRTDTLMDAKDTSGNSRAMSVWLKNNRAFSRAMHQVDNVGKAYSAKTSRYYEERILVAEVGNTGNPGQVHCCFTRIQFP